MQRTAGVPILISWCLPRSVFGLFFFFNDTATTEIYTLSLHDALPISNDEAPFLYVATFRASDHTSALWAYHDTGASPQGPFTTGTPIASGARDGRANRGGLFDFLGVLSSSQTPYIAVGAVALLVLLLAAVSHFRGSRRETRCHVTSPHARLRDLGLQLPAPPAAAASYVPTRLVPIGE